MVVYVLDSHIYDCLLLSHLIAYLFISDTLTVYLKWQLIYLHLKSSVTLQQQIA